MKIPGYEAGVNEIRKTKVGDAKSGPKTAPGKSSGTGSAARETGASTVTVSSKAKDIQRANSIAKAAPDVRSEKVQRIAREIRSGSYRVESKALAEKVLKDAFSQ